MWRREIDWMFQYINIHIFDISYLFIYTSTYCVYIHIYIYITYIHVYIDDLSISTEDIPAEDYIVPHTYIYIYVYIYI